VPLFLRDVQIVLLVFGINDRESFINLKFWRQMVQELDCECVLAGTKSDAKHQRAIPSAEAWDALSEYEAAFYLETSAKTGEGVERLFPKILQREKVQKMVRRVQDPPPKVDIGQNHPKGPPSDGCGC
jgi:GTPase SAR1 family protein